MLRLALSCILLLANAGSSGAQQSWSLGAQPFLSIGEMEGEVHYIFRGAMLLGRRSDGAIVVLDMASNEVRFFDAAGRFLGKTGRRGRGPGEYLSAAPAFIGRGDTLVVSDILLSRITLLNGQGEFIAHEPLPNRLPVFGRLVDGTLISYRDQRPLKLPVGPAAETTEIVALTPGGQPAVIARITGPQRTWQIDSNGAIRPVAVVFGGGISVAIRSDGIYTANSDDGQVRILDLTGREISRFRVRPAPSAPGRADRARWEEWYLERNRRMGTGGPIGASDAAARRYIADWPTAKRLPFFSGVDADSRGCVWLRRYAHPWVDEQDWDVYGRSGTRLATIRMPPRFRVNDIGADCIAGVQLDEFDVERITFFRLVRPQAAC